MSAKDRAAKAFGAWRERLDRGASADVEDLIRAHPDLAEHLRAQFAAMRRAERALGGAAATAAPVRLVGRTLGRWRMASVLGSGGMGTVFLATAGDERAAVKVLHPHLLARPGFVERFLREAEIGRRVRHANVVATLDAGAVEVDGEAVHYLVMEHVEGRTLRALLDDLGRLPEALCRHVGRETARALAAIHAAGAVHRDLKPDNVIVTGDQVVKVMDLGVARIRDDAARLSQTGAFVGSVQYGSPEQFTDPETVDARADLHALGLVLYELATGVHPFHAAGFHAVVRRVLDETPRPAAELNAQLSPFLDEVLAKLLAKNRDHRFASADEVAELLESGEESPWWRERAAAIRAETRRPLRRIRIPRETALYGRDAEIAKLRALYALAKSAEGRVVLVEGEAGIGKSRLVDEFVGALAQSGEDFNFLFGSYPPGGAATASGAFSTAYREQLGDSETAVRAALPQAPLLAPAFAALLRGDVAPAGAEPLTKDSLQTAFVHATRSLAAQRPTIILIDDLHFAPDEGRALFAALALAVPGHRILLVGSARPGLDAKWLGQIERLEHATRSALARLSPKDLVRVLADSLKSTHLAEELAGKIATKSDGNPFFVFEILRGLREGQFLTKRPDGTWATTKLIAEIDVPSSVVDLVQARVSDLPRADRDVLEVASCVGFEFDPTLVGDVLGVARIPLLQSLGAIEKSHRLVRSVGRRFVFDHHQVMEVLYAGLSEPLREEYHAAIGAAVEAKSGATSKDAKDLDGALCVELADHFLKGATGGRALRYLDAALAHLERSYLSDAAVRLADRALCAPGLLVGKRRCEVLVRKADRLDLLARWDTAAKCLEDANALVDVAGEPALRSGIGGRLGRLLAMTGRHDEARIVLEESVRLGRQSGDLRVEASSTVCLGTILRGLSRYDEARSHYERALAVFVTIRDRRGEAIVNGHLGIVFRERGANDEARTHLERSLAIAREIGDRAIESASTGCLAMVVYALGRGEDALSHFERAIAIGREVGDRLNEPVTTANFGLGLSRVGRYGEAQSQFEQALAMHRAVGDPLGEAVVLCQIAGLRLGLGDAVGAREAGTRSLELSRKIGAAYIEGSALFGLGEVAEATGDVPTAHRFYEESLVLGRASGHDSGVADSLLAIGDLRRRSGDPNGARTAIEEAVALARTQGCTWETAVGAALLACLPGGDAVGAVCALAAADPSIGSPRVRFLLWQATRDRTHLVEAKRLLDHLVAHAPPAHRESMVSNVPLHREIAEAARANCV